MYDWYDTIVLMSYCTGGNARTIEISERPQKRLMLHNSVTIVLTIQNSYNTYTTNTPRVAYSSVGYWIAITSYRVIIVVHPSREH